MKSHLLTVVSIIVCLLIFSFVFSLNLPKLNQITKTNQSKIIIKKDNLTIEWKQMIYNYLKLPLDDGYGSHAIVLLAALLVSKSGPILELGMGSTSSPLLHRLSSDQNRILVSADSDARWINYFTNFTINNTLHKLKHINVNSEMGYEWALAGLEDSEDWTVVFIDHRPGPRRQFDLMVYAHRSDLVILHDTEKSSLYKYNRGLSFYPYQYRFTELNTYTDVLSSTNESSIETIRSLLESTPKYVFTNQSLNKKM